MKNFSQFNEDAQAAALAAHQSRTAAGRQARSGTIGGQFHKASKRPKTGVGKFLKDKIRQMRKPELRSKIQQQKQKSSALTKRPESRPTAQQPVQKVKVGVQQDKKKALPSSRQKALPASQPRLTPAEKQKRLSASAKRKALPPATS